MCGISGIFGVEGSEDLAERVGAMNRALDHRGPDDTGVYEDGHMVLGHTRLSIIDPSPRGKQPMATPDGRFVLTYNGELYNYRRLREHLQKEYDFRSETDSEVVLAAYVKWGRACLDRLNGMFAFAVYDREKNELFVVRDRLGIKPLYYAQRGHHFCFSSEIRGLLASGLVEAKMDRSSLYDYLRYMTVHAPATILNGVRALRPGHYMLIDESGLTEGKYWDMAGNRRNVREDLSYDQAVGLVREKLEEVVAKRMMSDVPYGAFLSGGVDSSAVVALMSRISEDPVKTFSVGFEEQEYSEEAYAEKVARKYGTDHTSIRLKPQELLDQLPDALSAMDHPSGDGPNTYVVSGMTKQKGITMALSGLGGDELFAGYDIFTQAYRLNEKGWIMSFPKDLRRLGGWFMKRFKPSVASDKILQVLNLDYWYPEYYYPIFRQVLNDKEILSVLGPGNGVTDRVRDYLFENIGEGAPGFEMPLLSKISLAELGTYMQNVLLRDTDQMSMAHSLEVRVPLLDHELVELMLGMPDHLKFPHRPKPLLVDAMGDLLPEGIADRPKMGFTLPWQAWMKNELREFSEKRLDYLARREAFNGEALMELWKRFLRDDPGVTWSRLWPLVVLGDWLERHHVE